MEKRITNNAISAYLGMWLLLLIPSKNEYINNPFVKSHAKTASVIHILFLVNYIIFISYWLFDTIRIPLISYNLNHLIAAIIFLFLFFVLLYWVYKASKSETFSTKELQKATKTENFVEMKKSNLNEQWKLTMILSYIPFVWYYIYAKFYNYKSPIIVNNVKLNFLITNFVVLVNMFWHWNLANLFVLFYAIFTIFLSVLVVINENIFSINLTKIPTFTESKIYLISTFKYLKNYFLWKKFVWFNQIFIECENNILAENKEEREYLSTLKEMKLPKYLIYIPYLNLITLLEIKSKYKVHIINWLLITLISILFIFIWNKYQILLLLPIISWLWFLKIIEYKIPFIYDIYEIFIKTKKIIFRTWKKIKEKQEKIEEISYKIWE